MKAVLIGSLILGLSIISCKEVGEERVFFDEAQPISLSAEKYFETELQGAYVSCSDTNERLIINKTQMVVMLEFNAKSLREDLAKDTSIKINTNDNDAILEFLKEEGAEKVSITGDTIFYNFGNQRDTLFSISERNILKEFKGNYFLNKKMENGFWTLTKLEKKRDLLLFENLVPTDSLLKFEFAKKDTKDTSADKYILNPDKKGFRKLNRSEFFINTKCYRKV